jgi:hypothetical protein
MTSTPAQAAPSLSVLRSMSPRDLRALLAHGHPVDPSSLDDSEYRGISLGLPAWVEKLAWTTFMKTFYRDPDTGALRGWNVRLKQTGLGGPVEPIRTASGAPTTFGHFEVVNPDPDDVPSGCAGGLLIDYRRGGNSRFDGVRLVRDPLVALETGPSARLLGASYLQVGFRIMTPSFFVLERVGPLGHVAHPPGRPRL